MSRNREIRSKSQLQEPKRKAPIRNLNRDLNYMNDLVSFWGQKENIKLPPINVIEKSDFFEYRPQEIKFKMYQNCFAYNNIVHKEFEIKYISSPEEAQDSLIQLNQKVLIDDCLFGRSVFTKSDYVPQINYYSGVIDQETSCMYQIEYLPEHLISSSKTIRSIFYHYYLQYKYDNLPLLKVLKIPIIFRAKQLIRFKAMAPSISDTLQNGLLSLVYITEEYVPLSSLYKKKFEKGKFSYDEKLYIVTKLLNLVSQLEDQGIAILDFNLNSILINRFEGEFKISTMNLIPFIATSLYKEQWNMYDDYEKVRSHLSAYRSIILHPPELRKKEQILDYRTVTRYQLGLVILQIYFDLPSLQYIDAEKLSKLTFELRPKRQADSRQNTENMQEEMNPLQNLILGLLKVEPEMRMRVSLVNWNDQVVDEYSFVEDVEQFFIKENPPSLRGISQQSYKSNMIDSKQLYVPQQDQQTNLPLIQVRPPEVITPYKQKRQLTIRGQNYIRQQNLIAEIMFNFYMYQSALDQWQFLLGDVNDCFGEISTESEYILERIWTLAQHLGQDRILDQIGDQYMQIRKSNVKNIKEQLQIAYFLQDQARIKAQMERNQDAIKLYRQSIQQFQILKGKYNNQSAQNTTQIGTIYVKLLDLDRAKENLEYGVYLFSKMEKSSIIPFLIATTWMIEDQEVVRESVDRLKFWFSLFCLGQFYAQFESQQKALSILQAMMDMQKQIKENALLFEEFTQKQFQNIIAGYTLYSRCLMNEQQYEEAYNYIEEGIQLRKESLETLELIRIKTEILVYWGKIADAVSCLGLWVRKYQKSNRLSFETAQLLKEVGDLAYKYQDNNVAFSFYSEAIAIFQNGKVKGLQQRSDVQQKLEDINKNIRTIFENN